MEFTHQRPEMVRIWFASNVSLGKQLNREETSKSGSSRSALANHKFQFRMKVSCILGHNISHRSASG